METMKVAADVSVAGQVAAADVPALAAKGFRSLICNRPDGEGAGQPSFAEIEKAAKAAGLEIRNIPIIPGKAGYPEVEAFAKALDELPKPILAYCRSGARSGQIFQAALNLRSSQPSDPGSGPKRSG